MNTDKLLNMLLEAIDYSFLQIDGSYDKTLTYPVIDKIQYVKEQVKNVEVKEVDLYEDADNYWGTLTSDIRNSIYLNDFYKIAKHFFELGIAVSNKAQKGKEL